MAVTSRSRTSQSGELYHVALPMQAVGYVGANLIPHVIIVGTDVGGVVIRVDFAIDQHYGYTLAVSLLYDGGYGLGFVGCHHDKVGPLVDKVLDIGNLLSIVVVGRSELYIHTGVEESLASNLLVHLCAPLVVAALRYSYENISFLLIAGSKQQGKGAGEEENKVRQASHSFSF